MPKIRITETDATGVVQSSAISNTVFVPIEANGETGFGPILVSSITELSALTTSEPGGRSDTAVTTDIGYKLCKHLINLGFKVLVKGCPNTQGEEEPKELAMSTDDWNALTDKNLYDIRFLTTGSLKGEARLSKDMVECASKRGDCVALVDLDESVASFSYKVSEIRSKFETVFKDTGVNGLEYAAAFTPWFYTKNSDFQDAGPDGKLKNELVAIPASFGYLFAYANSIKTNPEWYAVAGSARGVIPELVSVFHNYSAADIEVLQARSVSTDVALDDESDNTGLAINPIAEIRPFGYLIYGNRTMLINSGSTVATSFLNIRNMVSAIKKTLYEASRKYAFEQNSVVLWLNYQAYITPLLDSMQQGNGILGYKFIKQATTAKARLKAKLSITPIEAVEDFDIEVYMTNDTTTVSE